MFTLDAKIRNFPVSLLPRFPGFQPLTISTKSFILDVWQGFEYTSDPDIPWFFPDISQTSCKENQSIWTRNWIINKKTFKENITHINYVTKENHANLLVALGTSFDATVDNLQTGQGHCFKHIGVPVLQRLQE